jgi:hypothetical protein
MHALDGSKARLARSNEHFTELKAAASDFLKNVQMSNSMPTNPIDIPLKIGIIVGEIVYNLRSALDYLIYELACTDSKKIVEGTQFPIEDTEKVFNTRIGEIGDKRKNGVYLRGVSDSHVTAIKQLQPFSGCQWTKTLRDISNPDKHRHLTIVNQRVVPGAIIIIMRRGRAGGGYSPRTFSRQISFSDHTLVLHILLQLQSNVTQTIESFYSEFI